ncbi:MAG: 50S ribosomal protein L31 [Anaerolineae bacterium]|jgi:large subunit ribosomal protein L31|nr:50S ribosomal protein L31 [Anaerolineae bacterium]
MREDIHPQWYPEARVICACGNTWTVGSTVPEIRTDVCSACHPFYTGEQRIVDTEGQVDRFMKRLRVRDQMIADTEAREQERTSPDVPIAELGLEKRYTNIFIDNGIEVIGDLLARFEAGGDEAILDISGIGRKVLANTKKLLRARGYELSQPEAE